jgi:hypothetical protein
MCYIIRSPRHLLGSRRPPAANRQTDITGERVVGCYARSSEHEYPDEYPDSEGVACLATAVTVCLE